MDHVDAGSACFLRRLPGNRLAEIGHGPGIRFGHAAHNADQRRLACAILAEKGVNFAWLHGEIDLVQGFDSRIVLLDLAELNNRR
ncbi:hypothetical protein [Mesorhizobium sp. M7A.F.Ca.CA.001.13.1.1]|uniref:hypothetical protein n=1 Tax=Mesorhizobium sp. M7A.F.Ca.CA.001.13.1.1 TaxID=2496728 RepID=UPI001FE017CF|nr:hypothetical protein [Mesorhizobium sp. M7A.F.Ca.CA.001.13.1.1]